MEKKRVKDEADFSSMQSVKSDMELDSQLKRHRVFLSKWQTGRPWLKTVTKNGQVTSMYCDVCQRHPLKPAGPGKPNDTFIKGSTNFRLEAVIRHELSLVHQKAQEMCEQEQHRKAKRDRSKRDAKKYGGRKKLPKRIPKRDQPPSASSTANQKTLRISDVTPLLRNAHAVALHCRSLSDYAWLCQLDVAKGLTLDTDYTTSKYGVTFLHYIGQAEREKIKMALQRSKFVSVIIDNNSPPEGAGITGSSEELVYLKSVCEGHVSTHFIERVHTEYPYDYQHVYKVVVKETLEEYLSLGGGDIWCKTVGFGLNQRSASDGRGAVLDVFKDVFIQRAPWIQGVHCEVGQMEDTVRHTLSSTQLFRNLHTLLQDVYELYKNPINRVALKVISFAKSNQHKIFKLIQPPELGAQHRTSDESGDTEEHTESSGWMVCMLGALDNLIGSYTDIIQHCQEKPVESPEECVRMSRISEALHDRNTVLFVQFTRDVLEDLHRLLKLMRDTRTSLFNNYIVTKAAVTKVRSYLNTGGKHLSEIMQQLTSSEGCYHGVRLTDSDVTFQRQMRHVVTSLCETLDTGYHDINLQVLSATIIADLSHWPQSLTDDIEFGDDCIKTLLKHFTPVLELAQVKLHRVEVEWNSIKMHLYNCSEHVHQRSWSDIHDTVGKKFSNFLALIDLVLALPSYSPIREQARKLCSEMKRDRRQRLEDDVTSDIMTSVLHAGTIETFNPNRAVELWAQDTGVSLLCHEPEVSTHERTAPIKAKSGDGAEDETGGDEIQDDGDDVDDDNDDDDDHSALAEEVRCSLCEEVFGTEAELAVHKRVVHVRRRAVGNVPCVCPVCKKTFKNKPSLSAHVSLQHRRRGEHVLPLNAGRHRKGSGTRGATLCVCNMCETSFPSARTLRHHKLIHHKLSPYQCDQCAKCFNGKTALIEHRRCHSGEKPHACDVCGKRFRRSADVKEHARTHDENRRRYPCTQCNKSFTQKIHLKYHLMTHTNDYRYYCDQCGKGFQMNCLLVRHKTRAHTHLKPYKCAMCDKSFKTNRDLKIHTDSHDPSKNYICNQCGKMFQSKHLVEGHVMRMHEKEKLPLECSTCGKRFRHPTMLLAHERVHTGETPFQCHTCGKTFKQKGHLTAHNRTHTGEKPYKCALCNTSFTVSCSLKKHMKYVHEGLKRRKNNKTEKPPPAAHQEMQQSVVMHQVRSNDGSMNIRNNGSNSMQQHRPLDTMNPNEHISHYSNLHQMSVGPDHIHGRNSTSEMEIEHARNSAGQILHVTGSADDHMIHVGPSSVVTTNVVHSVPLYSGPHPSQQELVVPGGPVVGPMSGSGGGGGGPSLGSSQVPTAAAAAAYWFMGGHYQEPSQ